MTGLVLKLSYNYIGETPVTGGICGSFFFIRPDLAVTANHVLNSTILKPNIGYSICQFWLIVQPNIIIELKSVDLIEHPEIDTTFIKLKENFSIPIKVMSQIDIDLGKECINEGFAGGKMPDLNAIWGQAGLIISSCNYNGTTANGDGFIKSKKIMNISAADIKITGVKGLETSYGGVVGMSGGPLINKQTNEIVGIMSIGLPQDVAVKQSIFAISIDELKDKIKNIA